MKKGFKLSILFLLATLFLRGLTSCSDNSTSPESSNDSWEYNKANVYEVSMEPFSTIYDSSTGITLLFPDGGIGNVGVSKIKSSPTVPIEGEGVRIDYQGSTPIELVVDTSDGNTANLLEYGYFQGCYDDEIGNNERWLEIPPNRKNGSELFFTLLMPDELSKSASGKNFGSNNFWIARLKPTADKIEQRVATELQVTTFYNQFINTLSSSLKKEVVERRNRNYLRFAFVANSHFYSGFWSRPFGIGLSFTPTIHLTLPPSNQTTAHETGHYLIHLLVGDTKQSILEGQGNLFSGHGVYDIVGRDVLLEDLAYFVEYFLVQLGADAFNLEEPYDFLKGKSPLKNDFPSYEGFAAHFLAQLVRTSSTIRDFNDGKIFRNIPPINLSYGQVFEIISKGATGINALRENITSYLGTKSNKLSVAAQRMGWQYSTQGKLINSDESPIKGASIRQLIISDGVIYESMIGSSTSDKDGKFTIPNAFPGYSTLRIKLTSGDSTDVPIYIDWNKLTTQKVQLDDIKVNLELDDQIFGTWIFIDDNYTIYSWTFNADGTARQVIGSIEYNWNWVVENGKLKLYIRGGTPTYKVYKIEGNQLYFWVEGVGTWSVPFTKQ